MPIDYRSFYEAFPDAGYWQTCITLAMDKLYDYLDWEELMGWHDDAIPEGSTYMDIAFLYENLFDTLTMELVTV